MIDPIAWLTRPSTTAGVRFADDRGDWSRLEYAELAHEARCLAAGLVEQGVRPGDVVCVLFGSDRRLVTAIYAVWAAGATICPVVPPLFEAADRYVPYVAAILSAAQPALVLTGAEYEQLVLPAAEAAGLAGRTWLPEPGAQPLAPRPPAPIALLQFTSGSTGTPRGVRVTRENLAANLAVIQRWLQLERGDGVVSWLPLHHDMGLIGGLLYPVGRQEELWLLRPDQFIRDPARWLECLSAGRARHTPTPTFGLTYAMRKTKPERLAELDLSGWRTIIIGAETVDPAVLERFTEFAAPAGFSRAVFVPAYGLAENTLSVTSAGRSGPQRMVQIDSGALRFGAPVAIKNSARLGEIPAASADGWLIGHGVPGPQDGIGMVLVDEDGAPVDDGVLGEIVVTGSSVADGYHRVEDTSATFRDGRLHTGDAGFVHAGDLYVLGRMGESIKLRGRNVFAEDLDLRISGATGLSRERIIVVGITDRGRPGLVVFGTAEPDRWADTAYRLLRTEFGPELDITLVAGPPEMAQRTSSGKPRRRLMWQLFTEGTLPGTVVEPNG